MNSPKIQISKSVHGTIDVVIYNMPNTKLVDWFALLDVWGSPGYDRFHDDGLYFELPAEMYEVIEHLPFIPKYHIQIIKY